MKNKDIILIIAVLLIACIGFGMKFIFGGEGERVVITVDGNEYGSYPLNKDREIDVDKHNTVVIKDGKVHMEDADCPDKLCIKQGEVSSGNEKIVCLPNKTVVQIESEKEGDFDAKVK